MFRLLRARLSRRIAIWVLVSILIIEATLVIPSYFGRRRILLAQLEEFGKTTAALIVHLDAAGVEDAEIAAVADGLMLGSVVVGGAIYDLDGEFLGTFGTPPALQLPDFNGAAALRAVSSCRQFYDVAWSAAELSANYHIVARLDASNIQRQMIVYALTMITYILIISAFVTAGTMIAVSTIILTPILRLRDKLLAAAEGQFISSFEPLRVQDKDELGDVMHTFNVMANKIENRTEELRAANRQLQALNDRLQSELALARRIQYSLLPPPTPNWRGTDIQCYSTPASAVGGDFYAYHNFDDSVYSLTVGDVSGKGMPAALMMAVSIASFQSIIENNLPPDELLTRLDRMIAPYTRTTRQNCAMVYALIGKSHDSECDVEDESAPYNLCVANAGCVAPLVRRTDGTVEWVDVGGMPLGIELATDFGYTKVSFRLNKGDLIILSSDGVIEANNAAGEMFSFDRLERAVATGPTDSAAAMLEHLRQTIQDFSGDTEPHDDLTLVVAKIN